MKNISKLILLFSLLITVLSACEKDDIKEYFKGGTPPVLTASSTDSLTLIRDNADKC